MTVHELTSRVDAGGILARGDFPVAFDDVYEDLKVKTNEAIKRIFDAHLIEMLEGRIAPSPNGEAPHCKAIRTRQTFSWRDDPVRIYNLMRTQRTYGGCSVVYDGHEIGLIEGYLDTFSSDQHLEPGTICRVTDDHLVVALNRGVFLRVVRWDPEDVPFEVGAKMEDAG